MRMFKSMLGLLILSSVAGTNSETANAQGFGIPTPAPGSTGGVPLTVTGRIVKENGDPLPGVQMTGLLQTESMGGTGAGVQLPVVKPFIGIPKACFTNGATVTTDADGRYTYRTTFLPDTRMNVRGDKCSTLRHMLTPANAAVVPSMSQPLVQQYNFEKATGPLPNNLPRVNPGVNVAPKALPGVAPLQLKQ